MPTKFHPPSYYRKRRLDALGIILIIASLAAGVAFFGLVYPTL